MKLQRLLKLSNKIPLIGVLIFSISFSTVVKASDFGFDYPLGAPDGTGYGVEYCGGLKYLEKYDYSKDGIPEYHPGEDWNDDNSGKDFGGDKNDKGDPVYSISAGTLKYAEFGGKTWGYIVLIEHTLPNGGKAWSQYAHLAKLEQNFLKKKDIKVPKGAKLGIVGDYWYGSGEAYHLHFEIRKKYRPANAFVMDWSKEKVEEYYYNPSEFIKANRSVSAQEITLTSQEKGKVQINWETSTSNDFVSYNLYRSTVAGGTRDQSKRTLLFNSKDPATNIFTDPNAPGPATYYYALEIEYKNGQVGISQEKSIEKGREVIQLTTNSGSQRFPRIFGNRVFWQDERYESNGYAPKELYYYDLESNKEESVWIGKPGASSPVANAKESCYYLVEGSKGSNIYCYSFETESYYPVITDYNEQLKPAISEDGMVVWEGYTDGVFGMDIYYLNLRTAVPPQPLVKMVGHQKNASIWKNKVVWLDNRRGGTKYDIYYKEIGGGEDKLIITSVGSDSRPSIWENWVTLDSGGKLLLYNLESKALTTIEESNGYHPRVRDGKIIYQKKEGAESYIWVYEMESCKKTKITEAKIPFGHFTIPDIYKNTVVWAASENQNGTDMNIFMTKI